MRKVYLRHDSTVSKTGNDMEMEFTLVKEDRKSLRIRLTSRSSDPYQSLMNPHLSQYGKMCHETTGTGYVCPVCNLEIDEYGYCGCGTGSS